MTVDLRSFRSPASLPSGLEVEATTSGSFLLDYVTGIGGFPRGKMVEVFGFESSGKSTAVYQAGGQAQRAGGAFLLLDFENAFTESYALQLGLDTSPEKLLVEQGGITLAQGFDKAVEITRAFASTPDPPPLIVAFDSVAAMPMEGESATDDNTAAMRRAKDIRGYLRLAMGDLARSRATWVFINHEMDNVFIGAPWEINQQKAIKGATGTPGGKSIKYFSSMRLQFTPGKKLKGDLVDPVTGEVTEGFVAVKSRVTAVKNKLAAPFRSAELFIRYGAGIDSAFSLVDVGVKRGFIEHEKGSPIYVMPDGQRITGGANAIEHLRSDPQMMVMLEASIRELIEASWVEEQRRQVEQAALATVEDEILSLAANPETEE